MLPGDVESQGIELDVSHSSPLAVQFEVERAEDREGDIARLSEALHLRVIDRQTSSVVAEGSPSELTGKAVPIPVSGEGSSLTVPGTPAEGKGRVPLDSQTKKNIFVSACFVFALLLAAASIAVALFYAHERLPENRFATGTVSLALEGGFNEEGLEPGRTVVEDFTITNTGSADVYWRMSFDNLQGPLSGALDVTVLDETGADLYQGSAVELDRGASYAQGSRVLASGQSETFTVQVNMNEGARNDYQGTGVTFDVRVDGVQSKNNEAGEF